jgi:hypothetical protein
MTRGGIVVDAAAAVEETGVSDVGHRPPITHRV